MIKFFQKIKLFVWAHKIISIVAAIAVIYAGYAIYKNATSTAGETLYALGTVSRGTIVSSVEGSGQVSAENQIDIKPKVSGTITYVGVNPGDSVREGQTLFSIDTTDAEKTVRDAQVSLDSAKLSLQQLELQNSSQNLNQDMQKAYTAALNDVAAAFQEEPAIVDDIQSILADKTMSLNTARSNGGNTGASYRTAAENAYYQANSAFEQATIDYSGVNTNSSPEQIEKILDETLSASKLLFNAIKNTRDLADYLALSTSHASNYTSTQNSLAGYSGTVNSHITALLADQAGILSAKDSQSTGSLNIQSSQLSVQKAQNALDDAKSNLADYYVTAPFSGIMAAVDGKVGDNASTGTAIGTIITADKTAVISLNEVDAAKIQLGQKATLTFDALPDLTVAGKVAEIDTIGTVSQGVVSYDVKISFDTEDQRVKPGMTVNAAIITAVKQDVLTVPNGAVKTSNGASYVEMFDSALPDPALGQQGSPSAIPPKDVSVQTGISDSTSTEIISGLKEGDKIVTKTISGSSTSSASAPSILNAARGGATRLGR